MKNLQYNFKKIGLFTILLSIVVSCDRDLSDDVVPAGFPTTAEIFTDNPVGLTDQFFRSFDPAAGANTEGFGVDNNEAFEGTSSIRIDVPASNDPNGNFIGGVFEDRGAGRNLSGYDALTFYAKGTTSGSVTFGFGTDFDKSEFEPSFAVSTVIQLTSGWTKYIIPIPDASKLIQEKGLFLFSAGGFDPANDGPNGNEVAWTFWIDELRFEKLGTIGQPRPFLFNGAASATNTFNGATSTITGLGETFNLPTGRDISVVASPDYFSFSSSNEAVATVSSKGIVTVNSQGSATISASIGGVDANGGLTVNSQGNLPQSPMPQDLQENVRSLFSDQFTPATIIDTNPGFGGSTTATELLSTPDGEFLIYSNNNFTGIIFDSPIDGTEMDFLHVDVYVQDVSTDVGIQIRDIGANQVLETNIFNGFPDGDDKDYRANLNGFATAGTWRSFDIPLAGDIASQKNNLGALILTGGPNFILDNIYFYKKVIAPTPNVDDSSATQKEFPLGFESSSVTYTITSFEGANSAIETNPDQSGINPTSTVMRYTKNNGAQFFAGSFIDLDAPIDFSSSQIVRAKVWSPKADIPMRLALEMNGGGGQIVADTTIPVANEWVEIEFDFSRAYNPGVSYARFITFFEFVPGLSGDGSTYYIDDLKVLN